MYTLWLFHPFLIFPGGPRYKRGRYSDPGPRGRDQTDEEKLESLIMRIGVKVDKLYKPFVAHHDWFQASSSGLLYTIMCVFRRVTNHWRRIWSHWRAFCRMRCPTIRRRSSERFATGEGVHWRPFTNIGSSDNLTHCHFPSCLPKVWLNSLRRLQPTPPLLDCWMPISLT